MYDLARRWPSLYEVVRHDCAAAALADVVMDGGNEARSRTLHGIRWTPRASASNISSTSTAAASRSSALDDVSPTICTWPFTRAVTNNLPSSETPPRTDWSSIRSPRSNSLLYLLLDTSSDVRSSCRPRITRRFSLITWQRSRRHDSLTRLQ